MPGTPPSGYTNEAGSQCCGQTVTNESLVRAFGNISELFQMISNERPYLLPWFNSFP